MRVFVCVRVCMCVFQAIKEEEIMGELPYSLRTECSLFIHRDIIRKTPFLSMLGDDVVPNLVNRLKPVLAGPTDIVVKEVKSFSSMLSIFIFILKRKS